MKKVILIILLLSVINIASADSFNSQALGVSGDTNFTYRYTQASDVGRHFLFSSEIYDGSVYGDKVAIYSAAKTGLSGSPVFAANFLIDVSDNTLLPSNALEIDVNQYSDGSTSRATGLLLNGVGTESPQNAIAIHRLSADWITGIDIHNVINGIVIDNFKSYGITILNFASNAIKFRPLNNNQEATMYGSDPTDSYVVWRINNDGSASFKYLNELNCIGIKSNSGNHFKLIVSDSGQLSTVPGVCYGN